jgi:hypothetical protein
MGGKVQTRILFSLALAFGLSGVAQCQGLAYGPDTCKQGYVWREAFRGDHVCVRPDVRDQAAADNREAAARRQPGGGANGPNTCRSGWVWREAKPDDTVCVSPATRAQAAEDNRLAAQRRAGASASTLTGKDDRAPITQAPAPHDSRQITQAPISAAAQCLTPPRTPTVQIPSPTNAANSYQYTYEEGVNRYGGDYRSVCNIASASACQAFCIADPRCKSWTWVKAGVQGEYPMCWLKSGIAGKQNNSCCTSGVKELPDDYCAEPRTGFPRGLPARTDSVDHAFNKNLPGSDFRRVCNVTGDGVCMRLCDADGRCRAWTWVKAGVQGPLPLCYLKDSVPPERDDACCISGHK